MSRDAAENATGLTVLFLILWFLIRRMNQSLAVAPVSYFPGGTFAMASAIIGLSSDRARSSMEFPGRVKNTSDQRSYFPCSFGGGLDKAVSKYQEHDGKKADAHHTMQIGPEDAPTEDGHCVSEIADGVSRNGLRRVMNVRTRGGKSLTYAHILPFARVRNHDLQSSESIV